MNKRFLPGQYCCFKLQVDDGEPVSRIGRVIDIEDDGQTYFVYCNGNYFKCRCDDMWHIDNEQNS